jgi:tetratricopeptide (TPR) repeat protein
MIRRTALAVLLLAPCALTAQQSTADQLRRAIQYYNSFNIEGARPILENILSPSYLLSVTPTQRVTALKYLGASYAVLDRPEKAIEYFAAALDFDPFTSLDPREFSATEQGAFAAAKRQIFKVAIRPVSARIIDSAYVFRFVTTHRANLTVTLIDTRDPSRREVLYQAENDGLREIPWNGLLRNGDRADSTIYELRAEGLSLLGGGAGLATVDRQLFRIEHAFAPLEDTLPSFAPNELLIEEYQQSATWLDLVKGGAFAAAAIGIPLFALNNDVPWKGHAGIAATVGAASGGIAFQYRRSHRKIPANVAENERRRAQRNGFNMQVRTRNAARVAETILLICPATGCPR